MGCESVWHARHFIRVTGTGARCTTFCANDPLTRLPAAPHATRAHHDGVAVMLDRIGDDLGCCRPDAHLRNAGDTGRQCHDLGLHQELFAVIAQLGIDHVRRDQFSGPRMHQGRLDVEDVHPCVERAAQASRRSGPGRFSWSSFAVMLIACLGAICFDEATPYPRTDHR